MKEYSSLLAVPLQKYVMCGAVPQCRFARNRIAAPLQGGRTSGHLEIPVAVAAGKQACW